MTGLGVNLFDPDVHFGILRMFEVRPRGDEPPVLLAAPPGSRYPYVYPRDLAGAARVLDEAVEHGVRVDQALTYLEGAARFLLAAEEEDGGWGQRYELSARNASIYRQEDNPAHGIAVLARYRAACRRAGRDCPPAEDALAAMRRAFDATVRANFRERVGLFESTTTVHESAIESGFTLWNNAAHLAAARLLADELKRAGEDATEVRDFSSAHAKSIRERLVVDGAFVRRLTRTGEPDLRPDVTLAAPRYFGLDDLDGDRLERAIARAERELTDPEFGLLLRYPSNVHDPDVHLHAGPGPWFAYSAMFAQAHARAGRREDALRLLAAMVAHATPEGYLPEHLTTRERFEAFWRDLWETGEDFRREFEPATLLPDVGFSKILAEANHMRQEYERIRERLGATGGSVFRFTRPLMWSHCEFLSALFALGAPERPIGVVASA